MGCAGSIPALLNGPYRRKDVQSVVHRHCGLLVHCGVGQLAAPAADKCNTVAAVALLAWNRCHAPDSIAARRPACLLGAMAARCTAGSRVLPRRAARGRHLPSLRASRTILYYTILYYTLHYINLHYVTLPRLEMATHRHLAASEVQSARQTNNEIVNMPRNHH